MITESSERCLVLAPTGRDASLIVSLLSELNVACHICGEISQISEQLLLGAGLAILAEEALRSVHLFPLARWLRHQQAWSDLPIILLTHRGGISAQEPELVQFTNLLGNVSFLERPFHPETLASMVRSAARSRHRQYEARARHQEIIEREHQLDRKSVV